MSNLFSRFSLRVRFVLSIVLVAAGIAAWQGNWRNGQRVRAANESVFRLTTARKLNPHYRGGELALRALTSGKTSPLSLASEDFDVDGVDDLAAGYATPTGGLIAFHRGNLDAFAPQSQASFEAIARGEYLSPYLPDVDVVEIPERPDFLVAGDVIGINGPGVVAAARGGNTIYVLARGASGKMELLQSFGVSGVITALDAHPLKATKYWQVLAGIRGNSSSALQVYTGSPDGLRAESIFQLSSDADSFAFGNLDTDYQTDVLVLAGGKLSILHNASQNLEPVDVPFTVAAATVGRFLFDRSSMVQIALLGTDGGLHIVAQDAIDSRPITPADLIGRSRLDALRPSAQRLEQPSEKAVAWKEVENHPSVATVNKTGLHLFKTRISNNANDDVMVFGASRVSVLAHSDERPLAGNVLYRSDLAADAVAALARRLGVHVGPGVVYLARNDIQPHVILAAGAILTVNRTDDPAPHSPISGACNGVANDCSLREAVQRANADNAGESIMVPAGTYTLTRGKIYHNYDGNQGTLEARSSFSIVGAGQGSTIIQAGTSSASTCVGAYPPPNPIPLLTSANYEVFTSFADPSACNSVDKIFSFNQDIPDTAHTLAGGTAFCTVDGSGHPNNAPTIFPVDPSGAAVSTTTSGSNVSFLGITVSSVCVSAVLSNGSFSVSNLTMQNGFNRGNVSGDADGFGGAFDFDTGSAGTATLTLTNVTLQNNSASQGGGATFFNFTAPVVSSSPTVTISNSIIQNSIANWADPYHDMHELGGFLGSGGGLQADVKTRMTMTNSQVLGNTAIQIADSRSGTNTINTDPSSIGGMLLFGQLNSGARNVIHSSTISGNKSTSQAGGIFSAAPLVIDTGTVISGNQAVLDGAGIFLSQSVGETATISNTTIINNTLVTCSSLNSSSDPFLGGTFCNEIPAGDNVPRGGGGIKVSNGSGGLTMSFSRILGNGANGGGGDALENIASTATVTNNWWGTNSSSTISGEISTQSGGTTTFDPFIVLTNTPNPVKIKVGATSQVTASVAQDNHGALYLPANLGVLVGLPASGSIFSASGGIGNFSATNNNIQSDGTATGTFTATQVGLETITASIDNASADAVIHVLAPPSITKAFAPLVIPADSATTSTLTFTITNPNQFDGLNGLAFSDTFAVGGGVKIAPTPGVVNHCGGAFTATAGAGSVSLSGGTINQNTTCTVSVNVVGTTDGIQDNTSSTVTATDAGGLTSAGTASASLTVINPPHMSKAFDASSIPFGATTSLTFTVNNPNTTLSLSNISFTDNLPTAAPGTLIVANPSGLNNTCGGTATANAGASTVSLTGVTLAHGASCTLSVNLQGAAVGAANNSVNASDTLAGTGNTATATFTVVKADTSTAVTSSVNPSVFGQSVMLTAAVSAVAPGAGTPSGTVTFLDGGSPIGSGTLSGGVATFTTSVLIVGNHTITTSYGGDTNFNGSTGSLSGNPQVVNKADTTTAVTSSVNPSVFGQSVTFTATVSPVAPGAGTPMGTVTFLDGGSPIGSGTLNAGMATFMTTALAIGNHTITTNYGGDTNFNGSTGSLTGNPQVVNKGTTTTTVASSKNPSALGQAVTFTATVAPVAPATGTPNGAVTFLDGGNPIGSGTLSGGVATFMTSALTAGNHTITASYGGDTNFSGSTGSLTGNPQVVVAPPTISKAFGASNVVVNGTTTLTVTLGNPAVNTAAENGVAFSDTFPSGLVVATVPSLSNTCGGTATATAGTGVLSLTGGTIAVNSSCALTVNVTLTTAGLKTNTTGNVSSTNGGTGLTATASVSAATPPTITKGFGASSIQFGGSTGLGFAIMNPNTTIGLSGVSFTDSLPAGLVLSSPPNASSNCGGSLSAIAGSSSISLTGGVLAASGQCAISVNVTGTSLGAKNNTTGRISATESGLGATSNTAMVTVAQVLTTSSVTVSPTTQQYSDPVTLTATISPGLVLGESPATGVTFLIGATNVGSATLSPSGGSLMASLTVPVPVAAGSYTVTAQFAGVDLNFAVTNPTTGLTVTKENASVTPAASNPVAVQVTSPGSNASQPFTLSAVIQEPNDGSLGDITKAVPVTFTLTPVVPGTTPPAPCTATAGTLNTGVTPNTLTVSCAFSGLPVNVYDIQISIGGNYYTGTAESALGVFDPSLGNVTGAGTLTLSDGNQASFALMAKYLKSGQVQGGMLFIEHRPGGNTTVKSNALGSLSIVGNTAALLGKATYNGLGNYSFYATGVDNTLTGGTDQFGLQVTAPNGNVVINLGATDLTGGNVQVPNGNSK